MSNPPARRPSGTPGAAAMSTERPLDALLSGLGPRPKVPKLPVHPRVLEVEAEDGGYVQVFACFGDPGSARELHRSLLALLEATLLAELSSSAEQVREGLRRYRALRLFVFPRPSWDVGSALEAFAFEEVPWDDERFTEQLDVLRGEARDAGHTLPAGVPNVWEAPILHLEGGVGDVLAECHARLAELMNDTFWGTEPGYPSRALAALLAERMDVRVRPSLAGLRALEDVLVSTRAGGVRWIEPLHFQALCDLMGVVAQMELQAKVAWSLCDVGEDGLAAPPVFRVTRKNGSSYHIPIAHHVLRWSVMPLREGERVPPLAEWLVDQIRSDGRPN